MFETITFYLFGTLCIVAFLIVVTTRQILYAMTALACGMIFVAGLFFNLDAEFLGAVQIIVYGGSVVALYAFAMMFFDTSKNIIESHKHQWMPCILSFGVACMLVVIFGLSTISQNLEEIATASSLPAFSEMNNVQQIGYLIFTKYLIAFELAAFMLLIAMVAGIILSIKRIHNDKS